ncbi:MAG: ATP-binding protein [Rhodoferax sp.]|nr:ATP-binding protein [Rhodoferax sp.]
MDASPESRIAALEAELAAVRAEMQDFTATVSHDLRAPLRHIVSYVQLVLEDAGPQLEPEVMDFLATISDSARHMGVLLDGLTTLSRIGLTPLELGAVSLQELVQAVRADLTAKNPQRSVEWQVADDLPAVLADAALLRQALTHVLGNALKFTAPRAIAHIDIRTVPGAAPEYVTLQVRDNGVGYNPAQQARLFRVFGRLHSTKQFEGIGIGLVLTRKILVRMGGSVSAQGVLDAGCCVELQLKRA